MAIVIKIKNLIGTVIIATDKESEKLGDTIADSLLKVLAIAQNAETEELCQDKTLSQSGVLESQD